MLLSPTTLGCRPLTVSRVSGCWLALPTFPVLTSSCSSHPRIIFIRKPNCSGSKACSCKLREDNSALISDQHYVGLHP